MSGGLFTFVENNDYKENERIKEVIIFSKKY